MKKDIIIIGAGAAGLMAAKELSPEGYAVTILEASDKAGGRMCTTTNNFGFPVEPAAEFIHGNLPLTLQLLNEAGIDFISINGSMTYINNGNVQDDDDEENYWPLMMQHMEALSEDINLEDFLAKYFSDNKYTSFRKQIKGFAEGFDLADISKAATIPLKEEWQHEQEQQYRIKGGYVQLTNYLLQSCQSNNAVIHYNTFVQSINWKNNEVTVTASNNQSYSASKVIITVPLGVLQAGNISFTPAIPDYINAIENIGFGSVIKVLLHFKYPFWNELAHDAGFIISNELIPTWWTQSLDKNLLTGWLGGPSVNQYANATDEELIGIAFTALSNIFHQPFAIIKDALIHGAVFNWSKHALTLGGYSYNTLRSAQAKQQLQIPVENTIYFAGEALFTGDAQSTVEAALQTGKAAAQRIIYHNL